MPNTPLYFHTIAELAALIQSQQLSPAAVTQALLERITQLDGRYTPTTTSLFNIRVTTRYVAPAYPREQQEAVYVTSLSDRW
jgi:Asp-tRNA(Asn)/Glu-tRNA(Gln) amidotransferase A subunit family amidase